MALMTWAKPLKNSSPSCSFFIAASSSNDAPAISSVIGVEGPRAGGGAVTVLTLFLTATILLASRLWLDMGRASIVSVQTQTAADVATLSSLRMRTESLRAIATRWQEYGDFYEAARLDGTVDLPAARWAEVEAKAGELERALPSYQGRSTAILKVVADANGFSREDLEVLDNAGSRHGVAAESLIVRDEKGQVNKIIVYENGQVADELLRY